MARVIITRLARDLWWGDHARGSISCASTSRAIPGYNIYSEIGLTSVFNSRMLHILYILHYTYYTCYIHIKHIMQYKCVLFTSVMATCRNLAWYTAHRYAERFLFLIFVSCTLMQFGSYARLRISFQLHHSSTACNLRTL